MKISALLVPLAVALALATQARAAERLKAEVNCMPAGESLVYDCKISLSGRKSGEPVTGANIVVDADMPSMAMAHNIKPVVAEPADEPGAYHARLHLEMPGEWALRLKVSGPARDLIVHVMEFGEGEKMGGHGGAMMHGEGMKHDPDMKQGGGMQ